MSDLCNGPRMLGLALAPKTLSCLTFWFERLEKNAGVSMPGKGSWTIAFCCPFIAFLEKNCSCTLKGVGLLYMAYS